MKKIISLFVSIFIIGTFFVQVSYAQLTGTKTIPGNYATISAAITDLNTQGVGSGGVTFNVAAGYTETASNMIITATGTQANQIIFQKFGSGANPLITAGVGVSTSLDGIIILSGSDYVTFNGIDLLDPTTNTTTTTQMEWGYAFLKVDGTNGAQNNTIKNCSITLQKINTASAGIYLGNHTTISTTALTVTTRDGANSNNKIYSNFIQNSYKGIHVYGYNDPNAPYDFYDNGNEIGVSGGNTIRYFGGGAVVAYGIYTMYQDSVYVYYNDIAGGTGTTYQTYGVYVAYGTNSSVTVYKNTVSDTTSALTSTYPAYGVAVYYAGQNGTNNTVIVKGNTVQGMANVAAATTNSLYGIYVYYTSCYNLYVDSNKFINNKWGNTLGTNTGAVYGVYIYPYLTAPLAGSVEYVTNNYIAGFNKKQSTLGAGIYYAMYLSYCQAEVNVYNNINENDTIPGTANGYGIYTSQANSTTANYYNNIVRNIYRPDGSSGIYYGIYIAASATSGTTNYYNNSVYNVSDGQASTSSIYGQYLNSASVTKNIYNNNVYNLRGCGSSNVYGFVQGSGTTINFYKNNIYGLRTSTGTIYGLYLVSGTTNNVYNNYISDLRADSSTSSLAISGIYASSGTNNNLYYNTIFLNAVSQVAGIFGTAALNAVTAPTLDLRNNIFVNLSTPGTTGGYTTAYYRSSTTLTTYSSLSNNNLFYAGTPDTNRLIFYDLTNKIQTLSNYKLFVTPIDAFSVSENPSFVNVSTTPYNLHLNAAIATQCESGASIVSAPIGITDDYDGNARYPNSGYPINPSYPPTAPDIGADEFGGIPKDVSPPNILYTALPNTPLTSSRTLIATITDVNGVPTSGSGLPVLYWKINSGTYSAVTATSLGSNQYSFTFGSGVTLADIVSYYICAQDLITPPNVGSFPSAGAGGFTYNPPAASVPPTSPSFYSITTGLSGDYTVGLTLFNKISGKNITFEKVIRKVIKEVTIEEPITKKQTIKGQEIDAPETTSSVTPKGRKELREVEEVVWIPKENGKEYKGELYLKKNENPNYSYPMGTDGIYANLTAAISDLNLRGVSGATRFLLNDAEYSTETLPLTINISNTSLPTSTNTLTIKPNSGVTTTVTGPSPAAPLIKIMNSFVIIDGSNTIGGTTRNLTISNTSTTTPQVVGIYSTGTTTLENDVVKNCTIINGVKTSSAVVVYGNGASAGYFNNITIQNNSIQKAYWSIYALATIATGNGSVNITGNNMDIADTAVEVRMGIYVQGCNGATVSNNYIGNMYDNYALTKRAVWFATGTTYSSITNNTIYSIGYPGTGAYTPYGITVSPAVADANILVSENTITNLFTSGTSAPYGIYVLGASSGITIQKNKIGGLLNSNTGGYGARGINVTSSLSPANINIYNNFVWNVVCTGDAGLVYWGLGIAIDATISNVNVYYNSVNLYGSYQGYYSATIHSAFYVGSGVTLINVRNNIFKNSYNNTGSVTDTSYAINCAATNAAYTDINNNDYFVSDSVGVLGFLGTTARPTLALWRTATGKDLNSISGNPMFIADTNLHIDPNQYSPVGDAGQYISTVLDDIDGYVRSTTTPDIGADEYLWIPPLPIAPGLVSPANSSIGNPISLNLVWNKGLYASKYHLLVATDSNFTNIVLTDSTITDTVKTVSNLNSLTYYYWKVRSGNTTGWSPYSNMNNFKTMGNATQVVLSTPANGAVNQPVNITFVWLKANDQTEILSKINKGNSESDNTEAITKYWFEYSTDSTFATGVTRDSSLTDTTKTLSGLANDTKYWWRVKAKNTLGWGAFSSTWNVKTVAAGLQLGLKVYLEGFWNGTTQVADTVKVYLAGSTSPHNLIDSQKVVLGTAGTTNPTFMSATSGNYFIVVRHRNHLETWSSSAVTFAAGTPVNYDFTTDSAKAFGNNMKKVGSVWVIFGGDPNQDGSIDAMDIPIFISQFGSTGYLSCDFNGDGDVNASDVVIISTNFGLTKVVPTIILEPIEVRKQKQTLKQKELNDMFKQQKKNVINNN